MPAGVSWGQYISFSVAAMFSMVAGSQVVHLYYKPMRDINEYINKELKNLPENVKAQIVKDLQEEGVLK